MSGLILSLCILVTITQLGFWLIVFRKLAKYEPKPSKKTAKFPVSVVICAKNEALNLSRNLPKILNQNYPEFEVIVVDDHSDDQTQQVLTVLKSRHAHLVSIHLKSPQTDLPGKKFALAKGLEKAQNEWVMLTDADCIPASEHWISSMISKDDSDVVLGYGPIHKSQGFLNLWTRFETVMTAIQYFSWAILERSYMGVGRNIGYKRSLFQLDKIQPDIASGDDDLFIQSLEKKKISINIDPSAFMYSKSKTSWTNYFSQKVRHGTASFYYNSFIKAVLSIFAGSHILFWILCGICCFQSPQIGFSVLIIKWSIQMFVFMPCTEKLKSKNLTKWFPIMDFALAVYYILLTPLLIVHSRKRW